MPTNKININHTKTKNQSQQTQHIFLGICIACLHYWSASVNQHCHTRQRQLNLCKSVGRICPWQYWLGLGKLWTAAFFDNALKTFIFKQHNNTLGYNYTVSKFVRHHPDTRTFCDIRETKEEIRETPIHFFFQCATTEPIVENIFLWALEGEYNIMTRRDYFGGFEGDNKNRNNCLNILGITVKKYLWDCKNLKKITITGGEPGLHKKIYNKLVWK